MTTVASEAIDVFTFSLINKWKKKKEISYCFWKDKKDQNVFEVLKIAVLQLGHFT